MSETATPPPSKIGKSPPPPVEATRADAEELLAAAVIDPPPAASAGKIGERVLYWQTRSGTDKLTPLPADLIEPSRTDPNVWHLTVHNSPGTISGRSGIRYSPVPKAGCWTSLDGTA